jgi:hypothetical protein
MVTNKHNIITNKNAKVKQYLTYEELSHKLNELERVQSLGVTLIYKNNRLLIVGGAVCVVVGAVTLPLPTGSLFLIALGLSLMVKGGLKVAQYKREAIRRLRIKARRFFKW